MRGLDHTGYKRQVALCMCEERLDQTPTAPRHPPVRPSCSHTMLPPCQPGLRLELQVVMPLCAAAMTLVLAAADGPALRGACRPARMNTKHAWTPSMHATITCACRRWVKHHVSVQRNTEVHSSPKTTLLLCHPPSPRCLSPYFSPSAHPPLYKKQHPETNLIC